MEILFLILKIIGILSAVLILLFFAVLAVPVRYGICMEAQDDIMVSAAFHWFCHLINMKIEYKEGTMRFQFRIMWIPVSFGRKKKKHSKKSRHSSPENITSGASHKDCWADSQGESNDTENSLQEEQLVPVRSENQDLPVSEVQRKVKNKRKGLRKWWENVRMGMKTLGQFFSKLKDKTITGKEKIQNIKKIIWEETNKSALLHLFLEMKFLMGHYSPRKASGELAFGMEDPSLTGQLLGMLSLLPFWGKYQIQVMPDFQTEGFYVKGRLQMKGHIRAWHMIRSVFRLIKDKNIRTLITNFRT